MRRLLVTATLVRKVCLDVWDNLREWNSLQWIIVFSFVLSFTAFVLSGIAWYMGE